MIPGALPTLVLLCLAGVSFPSAALAMPQGSSLFEAPRRLRAGDAYLGAGRMYPSPVFQDVNGDQRGDIVVGDLIGRLTWAPQALQDGRLIVFAKERALKGRSGEGLKFHNW